MMDSKPNLLAGKAGPQAELVAWMRDVTRRVAALERTGVTRASNEPVVLDVPGAVVESPQVVAEASAQAQVDITALVNHPILSGVTRRATTTDTIVVGDGFLTYNGTFTATLPTAAALAASNGKMLVIGVESGTVTLAAGSGTTIGGAASLAVTSANDGFIRYDVATTDWEY